MPRINDHMSVFWEKLRKVSYKKWTGCRAGPWMWRLATSAHFALIKWRWNFSYSLLSFYFSKLKQGTKQKRWTYCNLVKIINSGPDSRYWRWQIWLSRPLSQQIQVKIHSHFSELRSNFCKHYRLLKFYWFGIQFWGICSNIIAF
jgi:hypothetical protein